MAQSWNPLTFFEWFVPFFFGNFDHSFWGSRFYGGNPPLLYSLYAGTLPMALMLVSGAWRRGPRLWAWLWLGGGIFAALGAYNPLMRLAYHLPGMSTLRYPIKLWFVVTMAVALLAGYGFERALESGGDRLRRWLGGFCVFYGALWLVLLIFPTPLATWLHSLEPRFFAGAAFEEQRLRWLTSLFFVLLTAVALWIAARRLGSSARAAGAWLIALHVGSQLFLLHPLVEGDDIEPYVTPPPAMAYVGPDEHAVHGAYGDMFGPIEVDFSKAYPTLKYYWMSREAFGSFGHFAGIPLHRVYDLNHSPEGLDSFYTISLARGISDMDDAQSVRMLAASGVDALLLHRPLVGVSPGEVTLRYRAPGESYERLVYGLEHAMKPYQLVGRATRARHLNNAVTLMSHEDFDPCTTAVVRDRDLPADLDGPPGTVDVLSEGIESFVAEVDSAAGGVLTTRRAWLPIYRAWVDGQPADIAVINLHKLGVVVAPGAHHVEVRTDRRPTRAAAAAATVAALLLGLWLLRQRFREPQELEGIAER